MVTAVYHALNIIGELLCLLYLHCLYLHFPPQLNRTSFFCTCTFRLRTFVLAFSVLAFSIPAIRTWFFHTWLFHPPVLDFSVLAFSYAPLWYLNVTDGQTDRQTDRRTDEWRLTVASPRSALPSRGKNLTIHRTKGFSVTAFSTSSSLVIVILFSYVSPCMNCTKIRQRMNVWPARRCRG